jgi:hypothetical protein
LVKSLYASRGSLDVFSYAFAPRALPKDDFPGEAGPTGIRLTKNSCTGGRALPKDDFPGEAGISDAVPLSRVGADF